MSDDCKFPVQLKIVMTEEFYKNLRSFVMLRKMTGNDFGIDFDVLRDIIIGVEKGYPILLFGAGAEEAREDE